MKALLLKAVEALNTAVAGLEWYRDHCPDVVNSSDDEADEQIGSAIADLEAAISEQPGEAVAWAIKVHCSKGERTLRAGMQWTDSLNGGTWEVVEPNGKHSYSPSGLGGTPDFWCKHVSGPNIYGNYARGDGCVEFCGDSIAAGLVVAVAPLKDEGEASPKLSLTDAQIDAIADDSCRNAAGGIYATRVYEFARAVLDAALSGKAQP